MIEIVKFFSTHSNNNELMLLNYNIIFDGDEFWIECLKTKQISRIIEHRLDIIDEVKNEMYVLYAQ